MPKASPLQPALNAGEFSPRMVAREDFAKYPLASAVMENFLPLPQGGAMRRPGTRYVATVKDSAKKPRLLEFEFSVVQSYILEAGEDTSAGGYLRFYRDRGQIVASDTDAAIANGGFESDIAGWTDQSGAGSSIAHDAANKRLSLTSNGTTNAHAEQGVTVSAGDMGKEHVIRFRVFGAPGDSVKLRLGTTSTGKELVDDKAFSVGNHCYAFTPGATTFYVQFLHGVGKTLQVDDVSLLDEAAIFIPVASEYTRTVAVDRLVQDRGNG